MSTSQPYSGNPADSLTMAVRFILPDKVEPFEFSDDEIAYLLAQNGNDPLCAAICGAEELVGKYASCVDKSIGKVKISYSQKQKNWIERLKQLRIKKYGNETGKKCKVLSVPAITDSRDAAKNCDGTKEIDTIFYTGWLDNNEDYG